MPRRSPEQRVREWATSVGAGVAVQAHAVTLTAPRGRVFKASGVHTAVAHWSPTYGERERRAWVALVGDVLNGLELCECAECGDATTPAKQRAESLEGWPRRFGAFFRAYREANRQLIAMLEAGQGPAGCRNSADDLRWVELETARRLGLTSKGEVEAWLRETAGGPSHAVR